MSSADRPEPGERALLAADTKSYDSLQFPALGKVPDLLRTVAGALKELGFTTVGKPPGYSLNPALSSLRAPPQGALPDEAFNIWSVMTAPSGGSGLGLVGAHPVAVGT